MYTILKSQGIKKFLVSEMPALAFSLILAEGVYKFGSFIVECSAFLLTWYVSSYLFHRLIPAKKD